MYVVYPTGSIFGLMDKKKRTFHEKTVLSVSKSLWYMLVKIDCVDSSPTLDVGAFSPQEVNIHVIH